MLTLNPSVRLDISCRIHFFPELGFDLLYSNAKEESCFFPVPQAAECILRVVEKADAPVIYLSTDAAASETDLLQSLVVSNNRPIPMIKRPAHSSIEKWDALLYRNHLGEDSQVKGLTIFPYFGLKMHSS